MLLLFEAHLVLEAQDLLLHVDLLRFSRSRCACATTRTRPTRTVDDSAFSHSHHVLAVAIGRVERLHLLLLLFTLTILLLIIICFFTDVRDLFPSPLNSLVRLLALFDHRIPAVDRVAAVLQKTHIQISGCVRNEVSADDFDAVLVIRCS